jgi:hypothetical protein
MNLDDLRKVELKAQAKIKAKLERDALLTPSDHRKAPTLTPSELAAIQKKAYSHVLQKQYSELYRQQMDEAPDEFFNQEDAQDALITKALQQLHLKKTQSSSTHILLTINVKPEVTLEIMMTKINKMIKKKWLTDYIIAIEQRGEVPSDLGKGLHFHALLPRAIEPARIRKELASTFNSVCDTSNVHCMNIRWLKEKELPKVILYLQGQKKDSSKSAKTQMDSIYRSSKKLPPLLYNSTSIMAQSLLTPQSSSSETSSSSTSTPPTNTPTPSST